MTGVVSTGRQFINEQPLGTQKHLNRQNTDVIQCRDDGNSNRAGTGIDRMADACWRQYPFTNLLMLMRFN